MKFVEMRLSVIIMAALTIVSILTGCAKGPELNDENAPTDIEENPVQETNQVPEAKNVSNGSSEELKSKVRLDILEALEKSNESGVNDS